MEEGGLQCEHLQQQSKHVPHTSSFNPCGEFVGMTEGQRRAWQTHQQGLDPICRVGVAYLNLPQQLLWKLISLPGPSLFLTLALVRVSL